MSIAVQLSPDLECFLKELKSATVVPQTLTQQSSIDQISAIIGLN